MDKKNTSLVVRIFISEIPLGQMFGTRQMVHLGPRKLIDNINYELVKKGVLRRLAWGVFILTGSKLLTAAEIITFKNDLFGRKIASHGSSAARKLGISTEKSKTKQSAALHRQKNGQFKIQPVCVSGGTTTFKIFSSKDEGVAREFIGTCNRKMHLGESDAGLQVRAFWEMGKEDFLEFAETKLSSMATLVPQELVKQAAWMPYFISDALHALIALDHTDPAAGSKNSRHTTRRLRARDQKAIGPGRPK